MVVHLDLMTLGLVLFITPIVGWIGIGLKNDWKETLKAVGIIGSIIIFAIGGVMLMVALMKT